MKINHLATKKNLRLAWRRIATGGGLQYKHYYQSIYYAYEIALDANLTDLRQRLIGGSFKPRHPERIYLPKASGLHRPIALLHIEDQIFLQAFANISAKKIQKKRDSLQFEVVFSNILQNPESIFFFRRWQYTYRYFQKRIRKHYTAGMRWVVDFDLAAFYETISHELLLRTIYPRTTNADLDWIAECLKIWSSNQTSYGHEHGLPQGPLASDFLAECFLLPVDMALKKHPGYMRYADDVRIFGKTENEVRAILIELERHCRERGLIPQTSKFAIKSAKSEEDALGMLPSISDPQHEGEEKEKFDKDQALSIFRSAIDGKPYRVVDKTRILFVLYRAEPDSELLRLVLSLIPRHPEHADIFFAYIGRFGYRRPIERLCLDIIESNPYPYVRGEAWHVLAKYSGKLDSDVVKNFPILRDRAINIAKVESKENFAEKWGACHFLCVLEKLTSYRYSQWLKYQSALLQSFLAPVIPATAFQKDEIVETFLRRSSPEPGLSICLALNEHGLNLESFGLTPKSIPSQVANTLREIGVITSAGAGVDPISEILWTRYGAPRDKSWHALLKDEYVYVLGLLKQAEAVFDGERSFWLACQNSFNHAVFLALQRYLDKIGHPAACATVDKNQRLINFGAMLGAKDRFSRHCPTIGGCFSDMNARRNHLPVSHPYEQKAATRSHYLQAKERNQFVDRLRIAYADFVALMPS